MEYTPCPYSLEVAVDCSSEGMDFIDKLHMWGMAGTSAQGKSRRGTNHAHALTFMAIHMIEMIRAMDSCFQSPQGLLANTEPWYPTLWHANPVGTSPAKKSTPWRTDLHAIIHPTTIRNRGPPTTGESGWVCLIYVLLFIYNLIFVYMLTHSEDQAAHLPPLLLYTLPTDLHIDSYILSRLRPHSMGHSTDSWPVPGSSTPSDPCYSQIQYFHFHDNIKTVPIKKSTKCILEQDNMLLQLSHWYVASTGFSILLWFLSLSPEKPVASLRPSKDITPGYHSIFN